MRPLLLAALIATLAAPATAETPPPSSPEATPAPPSSPAPAEDAAKAEAEPQAPSVEVDEAKLRAMVRREAEARGIPPEIAEAVAEVESSFNPRAVGGVGEIGLMQVLPSTARMLGFREPLPQLFEPENNIRYGVRYLSEAWRKTGADICGTVMKYRAGHGETRYSHKSVAYCVRVRGLLAARGFKVTGDVPVATFGSPGSVASAGGGVRRLASGRMRMRFNWRQVDLRRKALDKAGGASIQIMQ